MANNISVDGEIVAQPRKVVDLQVGNLPLLSVGALTVKKRIFDPTLKYYSTSRKDRRGKFATPEYNLYDIGRFEDTDSYIRVSFDKKTALLFKEGWDIVGRDENVVRYVKNRLEQISQTTGIPFNKILRDVGSSIVRKNNAFIIKVRDEAASGGKVRKGPSGKDLKPVAGLFTAPAETMIPHVKHNAIDSWVQVVSNAEDVPFLVENVVHIPYQAKDGFIIATPSIIPVVDDVRALRKFEENIELLIYQHIFPLLHYKVGTPERPAGIGPDGRDELTKAQEVIELMPSEGGIVTSERHEIKLIGAEGRALRAENYLKHFKLRVFSGLSMSAVDFGEGETANRATADTMSMNLVDLVKDMQSIIELYVNAFIIDELLAESTFGESVFLPEKRCYLRFKEVDVPTQIKKEAHALDMFNKNLLGFNETRERIGCEPAILPSAEEVNRGLDTQELYPIWNQLHWKLFQLPQFLIQSLDEPWTPEARASLAKRSAATLEGVQLKREQAATGRPAPVVEKPAASDAIRMHDGMMTEVYREVTNQLVNSLTIANGAFGHQPLKRIDLDWVSAEMRMMFNNVRPYFVKELLRTFENTYSSISKRRDTNFFKRRNLMKREIEARVTKSIDKLIASIVDVFTRKANTFATEEISNAKISEHVRAVFDSFRYRISYLEDVEAAKVKTLATILGQFDANTANAWTFSCDNKECDICAEGCDQTYIIEQINIDTVAPFHPNCKCGLHSHMTPVSDASEDIDDSIEKERCVSQVKELLSKKYTNWSSSKVESNAWAICNSRPKGKK